LYSKVWPTISTLPLASPSSASSTASAVVSASGFSTSTCLPAARACRTIGACVPAGVATTSASTSSWSSSSGTDPATRTQG
jgi:hypothetical protein